MKKKLQLFIFVDALGYEIISKHNFMSESLPFNKKIEMQFGYSSTAIPTILSGTRPRTHKHFSFFYLDKENSPFKYFRFIPKIFNTHLFNRGRVRNFLSKILKKIYGYTGYFQLYSVPFDKLSKLNYCEKEDMFIPNGLGSVENLADFLLKNKISYHISNWRNSELFNINEAKNLIIEGKKDFIFLYLADLDGLLHQHVRHNDIIEKKLDFYSACFHDLLNKAKSEKRPIHMTIISDHGMTPLAGVVDLKAKLEKLPLKVLHDYTPIYDSTMLRVYFHNEKARELIKSTLATEPGHWLSQAELIANGINFDNNQYFDELFLMDAGIQIVPSDMGKKALNGMHGFAVEDKDSAAAIISNEAFPSEIPLEKVADFYKLMCYYATHKQQE